MSVTALTDAYAMNKRQPRILCVDSDVAGLVLLDAILSPRGYDVLRVDTGAQVLDVLAHQPVDLILLGAILPGVDGFAVCAQVRTDDRFRDIPIIMMSALKSREDLIRGIDAGADDYLLKPLDHEVMLVRIKMLLQRKQINDSLSQAYRGANAAILAGRDVIETFGTLHFDFQTSIDKIVGLLPGKTTDMIDKPRSVILGYMPDAVNWQWFHYEYAFHEMNRVTLDFSLISGVTLPEKNKSKIVLLGDRQAAPEAKVLIRNLHAKNISVENGIAYLSRGLCILAMNYGCDVGDAHLQAMQQVIVHSQYLYAFASERKEVEKAFDYMVYALARASEALDDEGGNHIYRVGEYCGILAERMGMKEDFIHAVSVQASLHDVGKIYTPPSILKKTEALTAEEWVEMKKHTLWGAKIIGNHPQLRIAQSIALNHHEKWDGSGYPRGLRGEAIPVEARIAALADQYDALRMARSHKPAIDHATVTKILNFGDARTKPIHFDPVVLKAYRETAFLFEEVYDRRKA